MYQDSIKTGLRVEYQKKIRTLFDYYESKQNSSGQVSRRVFLVSFEKRGKWDQCNAMQITFILSVSRTNTGSTHWTIT